VLYFTSKDLGPNIGDVERVEDKEHAFGADMIGID
jgi:hypothetical protein